MQVTEEVRNAVEAVIRDRLGDKVQLVEIEVGVSDAGEDVLNILVSMSKDTTANDFAGRFFGLTGRVRTALGENMRGIFPVIRPVEFVAAHA